MGLVFWIDQNTFSSALVEKVFKKEGLLFYTISSVGDFSYLIDDLNPTTIVLDGETFKQNRDVFLKQYASSSSMQTLPFIFLEPVDDMTFTRHKMGEIKRPFDPFKIPQMLKAILQAN